MNRTFGLLIAGGLVSNAVAGVGVTKTLRGLRP